METVTFSEKNSYADFGLILSQKEIGEAVPRTNYVDVPARDGHLDLTEAFGEVKYQNRTHVFTFSYIGHAKDWLATVSAVTNYINGKKHKIYIEANYYWLGRCSVKTAVSQRGIREIVIECDCDPYKYKIAETIINTTGAGAGVSGANLFNYANSTPYNLTNNNDGTFTLNTTGYYGAVSVAGSLFEVGKTYAFSQFVNSVQDSGGSALEFRVLMYHADGDYTANSVIVDAANKRYSVELTPAKAVTSVDIMVLFKGNDTTALTGVGSDIQIVEATTGAVSRTVINDRKTVTPRITVLSGTPILSWTDKRTGALYSLALPSAYDNKTLDFKLYEGTNTFNVSGGNIRLTYREGSL
jgi:hypothetical protein